MKNIFHFIIALFFCCGLTACFNDLDTMPLDDNQPVREKVYSSVDGYKGMLAKCYGSLILTGQRGGDGGFDGEQVDVHIQVAAGFIGKRVESEPQRRPEILENAGVVQVAQGNIHAPGRLVHRVERGVGRNRGGLLGQADFQHEEEGDQEEHQQPQIRYADNQPLPGAEFAF